jgi:hypothetical protein
MSDDKLLHMSAAESTVRDHADRTLRNPIWWIHILLEKKNAILQKKNAEEFGGSSLDYPTPADALVQQSREMLEVLELLMNPPNSRHGMGFKIMTETPLRLEYIPGIIFLLPYLKLALNTTLDGTNIKILSFLDKLTEFWEPIYKFASLIPEHGESHNEECGSSEEKKSSADPTQELPKLTDIECFGNSDGRLNGYWKDEIQTGDFWYEETDLSRYLKSEDMSESSSFKGHELLSSPKAKEMHATEIEAIRMAVEIVEKDIMKAFQGRGQIHFDSPNAAEKYYITDKEGLDRIVLDVYEMGQADSTIQNLEGYIANSNSTKTRSPAVYRNVARESYVKIVKKFYEDEGVPPEIADRLNRMEIQMPAETKTHASLLRPMVPNPFDVPPPDSKPPRTESTAETKTKIKRKFDVNEVVFINKNRGTVIHINEDNSYNIDFGEGVVSKVSSEEITRSRKLRLKPPMAMLLKNEADGLRFPVSDVEHFLLSRRQPLLRPSAGRADPTFAPAAVLGNPDDIFNVTWREHQRNILLSEHRRIIQEHFRTAVGPAIPKVEKSLRLDSGESVNESIDKKIRGLLYIPPPHVVILKPKFFEKKIQKQIKKREDELFAYRIPTEHVERFLVLDTNSPDGNHPSIPRIITPLSSELKPYHNTCIRNGCDRKLGMQKISLGSSIKRHMKKATRQIEHGFCSRTCQQLAEDEAEELIKVIYEQHVLKKVKDKIRVAETIRAEIIRIAQEKLNELFKHEDILFLMQEFLHSDTVRSFGGGKNRKPRKTRKFKKTNCKKPRKTRKFKKTNCKKPRKTRRFKKKRRKPRKTRKFKKTNCKKPRKTRKFKKKRRRRTKKHKLK